jgi:hypothetical protein
VQFEFSQKWRYSRQVPAATANNKLTTGESLPLLTMALDNHNILSRLLKNKTKMLALIDYS